MAIKKACGREVESMTDDNLLTIATIILIMSLILSVTSLIINLYILLN